MTEAPAARPAIIVLARAPRPGEGKTRLRSVLSDDSCLELQAAFIRDAVGVALDANVGPVYLAYTPEEAAAWVERECGASGASFVQEGDTLGNRMLAAFRRVESAGHSPLIMIGTDTPLLRSDHLRAAQLALRRAELCLGPSEDGGYYLLGCRQPPRCILENVPWGTDRVLEATLGHAQAAGLRCELLAELYDVDTPADLERLRRDLSSLDGTTARHTRAALYVPALS